MEAIVIEKNSIQLATVSKQLRDATSKIVATEVKREQIFMKAEIGNGMV